METIDPTTSAVICIALTIPIGLWILRTQNKHITEDDGNGVPNAVGGNALLGNALQYKKDPTGYIRDQEKLTQSKIFRINLAGRKMIIIGSDPDAMKQVASQPERNLSSCRAVAELGFEHTLGSFNVFHGTAWHKKILKNYVMGENFAAIFLPGIFNALSNAIETEVQNLPSRKEGSSKDGVLTDPNLFDFVRRCVLRATLDDFVSPLLLKNDPELLTALMAFQDQVEEATAKAAVLPRYLALPACLWPTEKHRKSIEQRITRLLPDIWKKTDESNNSNLGPWAKEYVAESTSPELAAEHLIGIVFAGHKNPSIGAAQAFCFLRSELSASEQTQANKEARELCELFASSGQNDDKSSLMDALLFGAHTLRKCVLETMRVTAHTLGAVRYVDKNLNVKMTDSKRSYRIAEGETVSLAHHTMHMDQSLWGTNAHQFSLDRPEWNEEEEEGKDNVGIPVDHYKLTTFSNGTHKCPGEKVALALMELQLALLLVRHSQLEGDLPAISFERATLAQRDGPVAFTIQA